MRMTSEPVKTLPLLKGMQVLAVDDATDSLVVLTAVLRKFGAEVVPCTDGRQAVHELVTRSFDAVVTDIEMPEVSGCDLVRVMRYTDITGGHFTPAISLSSKAIANRCSDAGVDEFQAQLLKPVDQAELVAALNRVVSR